MIDRHRPTAPPPGRHHAAARLMDTVIGRRAGHPDGETAPAARRPICLRSRERLAAMLPESALEELRRNNEDLIAALEDVTQQKEELLLLNAELQETNRGRDGPVQRAVGGAGADQPRRGRAVRGTGREVRAAAEASEAKNRFWANVSHELRTPLNSIIGLARLLADPGGRPRPRAAVPGGAHQDTAGDAARRWSTTCSTWPRPSRASSRIDPAEVDLPALLGHAARAHPADGRGQAGATWWSAPRRARRRC